MVKTIIMLLTFLFTVLPAFGHDHDGMSPELRQWFEGLRNQVGINCCSNADGFDAEWDTLNDKFRVKLEGQWYVVPPEALVTTPNRVGVAKVWWFVRDGIPGVRCFMPGTMG